jgi:hypothetical protein
MMGFTDKQRKELIKNGFVVTYNGNKYIIHGIYNKKGFAFNLTFNGKKFTIHPPKYKFTGVNSHFTFIEEEERMFRNKGLIKKIVNTFKRADIWKLLSNQEFFVPNINNKNLPKNVKNQYKEMVSRRR